MAIDRIGKGAALPQAPETSGPGAPAKTDAAFKVDRPDPGASAEASSTERAANVDRASGSTPLERFRAGEVDVNGYVDLEVDKATSNLQGLPASELAEVKSLLRDQMKSDPGLAELVRAATGTMPTPPDE
jgi:hypothetical protein